MISRLWDKSTSVLQLGLDQGWQQLHGLRRWISRLRNGRLSVRLNQLEYLLSETWLGLQRGGWLNWAAISTVTVLLFLLGIGLQSSWQVERVFDQMGSQLEISVYVQPGQRAESLRPTIAQLPQVATVEVITKDQAWQELLAELGATDIQAATQGLEGNPLVDELEVTAKSAAAVPELAKQLQQLQGVDAVQYLDQALQNLNQLSRGLQQVGVVVVTILAVTAIAVISTTIRLIVLARRQDIEIMQLVGATTTWIYSPFLIQGVGFGAAGAAIAWGGILLSQKTITNLLAGQPHFLQVLSGGLQLTWMQMIFLPLILVAAGTLTGVAGSLLAVRKLVWR